MCSYSGVSFPLGAKTKLIGSSRGIPRKVPWKPVSGKARNEKLPYGAYKSPGAIWQAPIGPRLYGSQRRWQHYEILRPFCIPYDNILVQVKSLILKFQASKITASNQWQMSTNDWSNPQISTIHSIFGRNSKHPCFRPGANMLETFRNLILDFVVRFIRC